MTTTYSRFEMTWTVTIVQKDDLAIHVLQFEKKDEKYFWQMPMIFLSQFIEPSYENWIAYCGTSLIDTNLGYSNDTFLPIQTVDSLFDVSK